jgi:hypothetical protein
MATQVKARVRWWRPRRVQLPLPTTISAHGAQVEDFENGHEQDAERGGGIGDHQVEMMLGADGRENERHDGAEEAEVKAGVEQVVLVFKQP